MNHKIALTIIRKHILLGYVMNIYNIITLAMECVVHGWASLAHSMLLEHTLVIWSALLAFAVDDEGKKQLLVAMTTFKDSLQIQTLCCQVLSNIVATGMQPAACCQVLCDMHVADFCGHR